MTLDEAIKHAEKVANRNRENAEVWKKVKPSNHPDEQTCEWAVKDCLKCAADHRQLAEWLKELKAYKEQGGEAVSRQAVFDALEKVAELFPWRVPGKLDTYDSYNGTWNDAIGRAEMEIEGLPPVNPREPKTGHCKECKYFEYDSVAKVDGIPLIVAHEICSRWGDGCKTKEDGYCFLYEPAERSGKE